MPGWSIVTLSDTQRTRGLVLEWTAVSLMLLGVYVACWVLVMLAALKMGASWLWPDSRRRSRYLILAGAYIVLLAILRRRCTLRGLRAIAGYRAGHCRGRVGPCVRHPAQSFIGRRARG